MGLTFTDILLLGSATTDAIDDVTFRIMKNDMLRWGAIARVIGLLGNFNGISKIRGI